MLHDMSPRDFSIYRLTDIFSRMLRGGAEAQNRMGASALPPAKISSRAQVVFFRLQAVDTGWSSPDLCHPMLPPDGGRRECQTSRSGHGR